ncbi:MAG: phosphomannomutase/phosphoglucomutase [Microbacteriaceae bacterium]
MTINWNSIVKAYDVRGLVGTDLNPQIVEAIAAGFVDEIGLDGQPVVIGHDMRNSSPEFAQAFARGVMARGANAVLIGLCSTDECYFASGHLNAASAMFTASHNPATYNGIKLCRPGAKAISMDTGLAGIRDRAAKYVDNGIVPAPQSGSLSHYGSLADYARFLRSMVDLSANRPLRIVVDAANGMGGHTVPAVFGTAGGLDALPIEVIPLYFELDGSFPNHEANPLDKKNLVDLQAAVKAHGADLGLAFDGDADRCFVVDELGQPVSPSTVASIVAVNEIARAKRAGEANPTVLYGHLSSRVFAETIEAAGGRSQRTKVGHSLIKKQMAETDAIFGAEHSAHYYFRDFWFADSGILAAMHVLHALGNTSGSMSELADRYKPYPGSGEVNLKVSDAAERIKACESKFADHQIEHFDGLTVSSRDASDWWWFNLRTSNTEPLLRLNAEAASQATLDRIIREVMGVIQP